MQFGFLSVKQATDYEAPAWTVAQQSLCDESRKKEREKKYIPLFSIDFTVSTRRASSVKCSGYAFRISFKCFSLIQMMFFVHCALIYLFSSLHHLFARLDNETVARAAGRSFTCQTCLTSVKCHLALPRALSLVVVLEKVSLFHWVRFIVPEMISLYKIHLTKRVKEKEQATSEIIQSALM